MNWGAVGLVACAVALGAPCANAQMVMRGPGVFVASDFDAPYDDGGPPLPPRYAPAPYSEGPAYAPPPPYASDSYGPSAYATPMLPPGEIVRIARQNGFSPLGAPQQRGFVYRLPVLSPDGDDGRLVIDARSGRIIRFLPAMEYGSRFDRGPAYANGPVGTLPPRREVSAALRPPSAIPRIAAPTTVAALPKPAPATLAPAKPAPAPAPRQADVRQSVPPAPPAAVAAAAPSSQPAAAPAAMPPAQGLD